MVKPLRIANCSGFYGDRLSAAQEMVTGGPIDVLTGDWLAELTMLILAKDRMKDPARGYAKTFLKQLEVVLGTCLDSGIRIVSNAGGLNPAGCAEAISELAQRLGLTPTVAFVGGDDLIGQLDQLQASGEELINLDTGEHWAQMGKAPITANAYLGSWGISTALGQGADVVVTGRVTDASLVVGPAAWHFDWAHDDWDQLAGAIVAGHAIECGTQVTGGNYSFFDEIPNAHRCGFPIAEVFSNGSSIITKHPGTGGAVSIGTVTAQLVYEIASPSYANPDATALFDTITLETVGPDRVQISGVRGTPPSPDLKVGINYLAGFRNSMTFLLTGLDISEKAQLAQDSLWAQFPEGPNHFESVSVDLIDSARPNPPSNQDAISSLRVTVSDPDASKVGRAFSSKVVELALASYPGFTLTTPPQDSTPYGIFWPTTIDRSHVDEFVEIGGTRYPISHPPAPMQSLRAKRAILPRHPEPWRQPGREDPGIRILRAKRASRNGSRDLPLGVVMGARSGDKGGNANIGVWTSDVRCYEWLDDFLSIDKLRELMPETKSLEIHRYRLANLNALNFVVVGLLGRGVAASTRIDPQAKGLGEYLRAKVVPLPVELLSDAGKKGLPTQAAD